MEQPPNIVPPRRTEPLAVGSLVLGILGLVTGLALILSPIALAMGVRAKQRIMASGGTTEGYGMAQAGFVLGIIGTVIAGLFVLFLGFCLVAISSSGSM